MIHVFHGLNVLILSKKSQDTGLVSKDKPLDSVGEDCTSKNYWDLFFGLNIRTIPFIKIYCCCQEIHDLKFLFSFEDLISSRE